MALAPWARDFKPEDFTEALSPDVCLQEVKFILNPVLPLSFLWEPGQIWPVGVFCSESFGI